MAKGPSEIATGSIAGNGIAKSGMIRYGAPLHEAGLAAEAKTNGLHANGAHT